MPTPETYVKPAGKTSVTVIVPVVDAVPASLIVMIYVPLVPGVNVAVCVFTIMRSTGVVPHPVTNITAPIAITISAFLIPAFPQSNSGPIEYILARRRDTGRIT